MMNLVALVAIGNQMYRTMHLFHTLL